MGGSMTALSAMSGQIVVDAVVAEYGIAKLGGELLLERACRLIGIAVPD